MTHYPAIEHKIRATSFIDTHEHLLEESTRLAGPSPDGGHFSCDDWAYLFRHYTQDDLLVSGMPADALERFFSMTLSPREKWDLFAPYWPRVRHSGYGRAVSLSVKRLYDEDDIGPHNVERITEKMRANVKKGFYREILQDVAGIESCQVNSQQYTFCETEYPDLLYQDLSTVPLSSGLDVARMRYDTGLPVGTLDECHQAIDWYFERYGRQAVATKNQSAYQRRLDYTDVPAADAAPLFARHVLESDPLSDGEMKALQDHLWRYCVQAATEHDLPVKLHTGYYAGANNMPLARVSMNLKDLCPILQDFPDTRFVLMHMTYPYQDELIALAKQYSNVTVDLCWAWIINPVATVRFVKEFLTTVPCNKILTFGGDYIVVENVVGHAEIARWGLERALSDLVDEDWLSEGDALSLVEPLMRGNAWDLFRMDEKTKVAAELSRLGNG